MSSGKNSSREVTAYRSQRLPLLFMHLLAALLFGFAGFLLVQKFLLQPLQDKARMAQQERAAHISDWLQNRLDGTRHFAAAFHALTESHWKNPDALRALSGRLLATLPPDSAIVAAGIWPEPSSFRPDQVRDSLYWTVNHQDQTQPEFHADYNDPERISYFSEIWYEPLREAVAGRCHFTRLYQEPFLQRPVFACATPVRIGGQFAGVSTLVIDPARWQMQNLSKAQQDSNPDTFFLLLDDELRIVKAAGVDAREGDNLPSLGQRDALFGSLAVELHQLTERRTAQARNRLDNWDQRVARIAEYTRGVSERQAAQLLARLTSEPAAGAAISLPLPPRGQQANVTVVPLAGFGSLLLGSEGPPQVADLPLRLLIALAATLGSALLALLLTYALNARRLLTPLQRLIHQLQMPAEDTVLEAAGRGEIGAVVAALNQRHERIRQLMRQHNADAGHHRPVSAAQSTATDDGGWQVLEALPDAIVLTDSDARIVHLNHRAETLSGWKLDAARGLHFDEVFHIKDRRGKNRLANLPTRAIKAGRQSERPLQVTYVTRSGHQLPLSISSGPYHDFDAAKPSGVLLLLHDSRHDTTLVGRASSASIKDPMTGMLNRQTFDAELTSRCEDTRVGGEPPFHLLYVDVDRMDRINGDFGTEAGDELLRQLARLIQSDVGERNPVYRLLGDKFGILLDTEESAEAQVTAELLRADAQSWGFQWDGQTSEISISVGLVRVDRDSGRPIDVLRAASELCEKAQMEGGGRVLTGEAHGQRQQSRDDRYWLNNIKRGLSEDRFHLSTQQIKPLQRELDAAGEVFDTLLLLEDEEGFWTESEVFMPIAQSHDMATQLDRWTFERVFGKLQQDESLYEKIDFCVVSASVSSAQNMGFLDFLMEKFQETGIARSKICIDLHERDVQSRLSVAREFCQALSRAGCRLSLSGASTRPSSYKLIRDLPVQIVRFDPMITRNAAKDPLDRLATESLHRIVHSLNKRSIATHVDSADALRVMQGIGLDYAQGDGVARATPMLFQAQV